MNPTHPTIEQIADLQEGLLAAAEAVDLRAHLTECAACAETVAQLAEVSALLTAEGAEAPALPVHVAESLHAALERAAAEQAADVPVLAERRSLSTSPADGETSVRRRGRPWFLAAAAAAAVVVFGGAAIQSLTGSESSPDAASTSEESGAGGSDAENALPETAAGRDGTNVAPTDPEDEPPRIAPDRLADYASRVAAGSVESRIPRGRCARVAADLTGSISTGAELSQYAGGSELSLLVVDEAFSTYRLVDCDTGAVILRGALR